MVSQEDVRIEYCVPIIEKSVSDDEFIISGIAINETITRNNIQYTAEELSKSADGLKGKPVLKDHSNMVGDIVGRVKHSSFDDGKVLFKAQIMDAKMKEMINDGRLNSVSIGAKVSELGESDSKDVRIAKGIEFLELSLVAVPGDPNALINGFDLAIAEKFKLSEEVSKMAEDEKPEEQPEEEEKPVEEPKEEEKEVEPEVPVEAPKEEKVVFDKSSLKELDEELSKLREIKKLKDELKEKKVSEDLTKSEVVKEEVKEEDASIVQEFVGNKVAFYSKETMDKSVKPLDLSILGGK